MVTVKIILKTNRKLSDGSYTVVISLAHLKKATTYIRLKGLSAKLNQWSNSLSRKRSLSKEQLKDLIKYEPLIESQKKAEMVFLFSFYIRGINLMDMLQLTDKNIEEDFLVYKRQKTGKQMRIKLVNEAKQILEYFKNETEFLFPHLKKGEIPKYRVRDVNSNINRRLKPIGKTIGVEGLTMYFARHTFAELNYKAGVRIEIISQMLGHSDLKTTQTYLISFSDDEVDDAASTIFESL